MIDALKDALELMTGWKCLAVRSYDELVQHQAEALGCKVAVLDINLGEGRPSGIEAYRWLKSHAFSGKVFFLTGHARSHPLVVEADRIGAAQVIQKPVDLETFLALIEP